MKLKSLLLCFGLFIALIATSCADSQDIVVDGKLTTIEPYGWADASTMKNDSILYKVNVGNIVWSVILSETIFVPVILTGWYLNEPVKKKL